MASFKAAVDRVRQIVRAEGEITTTRLAYILNVSPSQATYLLRAAAELDDRILYIRGTAKWIGEMQEKARQEAKEGV